MEDPAAGIGAKDSTVQSSAGVELVVTFVVVEAATTTTVPEVLATTSVSDEPIVASPLHNLNWFPSLVLHEKGVLEYISRVFSS